MSIAYPRDAASQLYSLLLKRHQQDFASWRGSDEVTASASAHYERIRPIPSERVLADLLDIAFFASITQEEGKSVSFTLLYCDPEVAIESKWPAIKFTAELPLAIEHIRKLSPATDSSDVDIAVFDRNGDLFLWGLVYIRHSAPGALCYPPGLSVSSRQAGVVVVQESMENVLIFRNGTVTFFDSGVDINKWSLRQILAKAFDTQRTFPDRYATAARIIDMASVALENGSGATVLVVPEGMNTTGLDAPKYSVHDSSRELLAAALSDQERTDIVKSVARLAFVDGALVLDEHGALLGAGTMIRTEQTLDFDVLIFNPAAPNAPPLRRTLSSFSGGARHRSALVFCYLNPGTLSLVVSHDGVMSVMTRPIEEDGVAVFRPFLRGFDLGI